MKLLHFPKLMWFLVLTLIITACSVDTGKKQASVKLRLGDFGAFYTKVYSGEAFEKNSRTGDYADIVVDLGSGDSKFVFWRGSSFLPYLETPEGKWYVEEMIPRTGDGEGMMPDRINTFSRTKIVESNENRVIVHWRYLPEFSGNNPHLGVSGTKFVDEYFTIKPDGSVKRTFKKGTPKIDDWKDPKNKIVQTFNLTASGITELETNDPGKTNMARKIEGSRVVNKTVVDPVAWWRFDEAVGDEAVESINEISTEIQGHKSLWKKGVSGTALQFDGYKTLIELEQSQAPELLDGITLEAWMAISAYPWNWTPMIQQGDDEGYFLGLNGHGFPGFKIMVGDVWEELVSDTFLEKDTWYHLAATYDMNSGVMKIYVNGKEAGSKTVGKEYIGLADENVKIGKGMNMKPTDPVRENTFVDSYGFDGMIDEVRIYDVVLSGSQVSKSFSMIDPGVTARNNPDMEFRSLPVFDPSPQFGATYTRLRFYEVWDNYWRFSGHPDVVVNFDELPTQFVFWRGTGYIPMMVNEKGQWYSNEFNETWETSGGQGCQEPMSDKEAYTNHAKIIENTDARVVVQWRYPLLDVLHVYANVDEETGWGDWSDWYYYIYPDGVAAKKMHLWTHGDRDHEWQESMGIFGPNQHPEDVIETEVALTMVDLDGNYVDYSWEGGPPDDVKKPDNKVIQHINYKADYDPVSIGDIGATNVYGGEITPYSVFPSWNHWPVAQMPSDGRYASFSDRTAHSSLSHLGLPTYAAEEGGNTPYQQKILLEGMLNQEPVDLVPLAKSWINAPEVINLDGCTSTGFDRAERAFMVNSVEEDFTLSVAASEDSPLFNPCFVITNWAQNSPASLAVDGVAMTSGKDVRQGVVRDTDGSWKLVVWFKLQSSEQVDFVFENNTVGNNEGVE